MTNPYPAVIITSDGLIYRITGEITFTDPANQPGGGGGGTVDSVTAGDASITIAGTAADPTVAVASAGITSAKMGTNAVTSGAIAAGAVTTAKISSGAAGSGQLLTADGAGGVSFAPNAAVGSVTAADTSVVVGGTATAPTVRTNTLDVVAADHPPAADWSNNSHKITNLTNGSASSDAAAFGQIPTTLPPSGSAGGDLSGTYPNPSVVAIRGVAVSSTPPSANDVLTATDSTHAAWAAPAGSGTVTSVTSANSSITVANTTTTPVLTVGTIDKLFTNNPPAASCGMNSQKITSLANGSASSDAAAFGQIPSGTSLVPSSPSDAGQFLDGAATPAWTYPPGHEYGYDQITNNVSVTSHTESSGTTVITCAAHTFDGSKVLVTFFASAIEPPGVAGQSIQISLFESSTQITRLAFAQVPSAAAMWVPCCAQYEFTPTAASHTYTVTAFTSGSGTGTVQAGSGGTNGNPPSFIRFTKV